MNLTREQQAFRDKAIEDAKSYGGDTALLLVASLAAGYGDDWSDIDMWMLGLKSRLSREQREEYDRTGGVFVDRGDLEAHYTFYDIGDMTDRLNRWRDESLWLIRTAQIIHDQVSHKDCGSVSGPTLPTSCFANSNGGISSIPRAMAG